ncbi:SRPBCC domain-containing protein [Fulvivirgaceae bacterium BMA10]|uniref:SRPBCC domain-containing protein n=1 Tax=Splendidivirga corallicola TaxID=3051826 RepID=A0ABT8KJL8_9BACT|nr:SRPBCC domain-containing protein [Fulvivirgaceae bacterium BMA10]
MKTIVKNYDINASKTKVYEALTDQKIIESWSGSPAKMDLAEGGEFSLWGGTIHGVNHKITQDQIIQDWKEEKWEAFSKCTFNLDESDGVTHLELVHEDIPDGSAKSIDNGWDIYYLGPLKELLEK